MIILLENAWLQTCLVHETDEAELSRKALQTNSTDSARLPVSEVSDDLKALVWSVAWLMLPLCWNRAKKGLCSGYYRLDYFVYIRTGAKLTEPVQELCAQCVSFFVILYKSYLKVMQILWEFFSDETSFSKQ